MTGYVYIMTNAPDGVLYIGVTSDLVKRVYEHRQGMIKGFTSKYHCKRLVYYECYDRISDAIQREKNMKHYLRQWKVDLITSQNPGWCDLYEEILGSSLRMTELI